MGPQWGAPPSWPGANWPAGDEGVGPGWGDPGPGSPLPHSTLPTGRHGARHGAASTPRPPQALPLVGPDGQVASGTPARASRDATPQACCTSGSAGIQQKNQTRTKKIKHPETKTKRQALRCPTHTHTHRGGTQHPLAPLVQGQGPPLAKHADQRPRASATKAPGWVARQHPPTSLQVSCFSQTSAAACLPVPTTCPLQAHCQPVLPWPTVVAPNTPPQAPPTQLTNKVHGLCTRYLQGRQPTRGATSRELAENCTHSFQTHWQPGLAQLTPMLRPRRA